jgi:hypothetical protein
MTPFEWPSSPSASNVANRILAEVYGGRLAFSSDVGFVVDGRQLNGERRGEYVPL